MTALKRPTVACPSCGRPVKIQQMRHQRSSDGDIRRVCYECWVEGLSPQGQSRRAGWLSRYRERSR